MNIKGAYLFLIILIFFNCSHKNSINEITIGNLEEKIDEAFLDSEIYDKTETLIPVLFFIDRNNIIIKDSCVLSKVYHLKAIRNYTLSETDNLLENTKQGIIIAEKCDKYVVKTALNNLLGIFFRGKKDYRSAINYYNKAIFYGEKNNDKQFVVDTYFSLCQVHANKKDWNDVLINAEKGIAAIEKSNSKLSRLKYFHTFLAQAYTNLEEYNLAKIHLSNAIDLTEKSRKRNVPDDILKSYRAIYIIYAELNKKQNNFDLAYQFMKSSDSLLVLKNQIEKEKNSIFLNTESSLEKELFNTNNKVIFNHKIIIIGSILFLLISFFFIFKSHQFSNKLKKTLSEKKELNTKLLSNFDALEETNNGLIAKNEEIASLLKFNEQTLLTKTLKISNYKDAVNNVIKNINKLIEQKENIKSVKMHSVNRSLQQIISEEDFWIDFKIQFKKNRPEFFDKLLERLPTLTVTEQKHCAYIAVNLKSKEVANILNLSPRSVETTRYRIKKKLKIENETLQEFLSKL
ncbi:LuxR C-terminal-related transcriptional regulator [Polaribacter sp. MSW13]|uniref:LuxR C-terminal-related transcriptional regulator n=1 Tax=Polaribacter marinus TaxID=2916838 RepID=A0A9X1VKQ3_9FLAO|nr:LuxR C-terminal-related transcriptional regulator [Polaribacter marinus]MCI2227810.1 LuxR C-terminal-related transcriptional regulator [Polaribacter marinus]